MVSVNLVGRLGNQLFQIGAALAYANRFNMELHVPNRTMDNRIWPMSMPHLGCEAIDRLSFVNWVEPSHAYTKIPYFKNVVLNGYFQSAKYIDDARPEILDTFAIPWQSIPDMCSIHVRRGDYLQFEDKHPTQKPEYFHDAIAVMVDYGIKSFVVCSDDIQWCRKNFFDFKKEFDIEFTFSENNKAIEDLALLSCTRHQIISNSSFSWWGHWLNRHEDKLCIAPKVWFGAGNNNLETKDIYFENAILI